jgi:hypothetical protein
MMKNSYLCINAKKCIFFVRVWVFSSRRSRDLIQARTKGTFWPRCTFLGDRTNYKAKDIIGNNTNSFVFIYLLRNQAIQNLRNSFSRGFPLPFNVETLQAFEALFQILHYGRKFLYCKPKYHLLHALPNRFVHIMSYYV